MRKATRNTSKTKLLFDAAEYLTRFRTAYQADLGAVSAPSPFQQYARERWLAGFHKKFLLPGDKATREDKAYAKFFAVNEEMRRLNESLPPSQVIEVDAAIHCAKHLIDYVLGPLPELEEIFLGCKNSQGTSIGVPFWDTSPERKFRFPISMTAAVEQMWEAYLRWDQDLVTAIVCLNEESTETSASVTTDESRACTVPKTDDIDRMIAVEPVVNMYFQHGIAAVMEARLKRVGLSFDSDQEYHRYLAYLGSVTNGIATIDFSSMSDRVSLAVAKLLLPAEWFSLLCLVRCPRMSVKGTSVELAMISTMGNATTFPLETLLLWSLAVACNQQSFSRYTRIPDWTVFQQSCNSVSVYGDDCIMPTRGVPLFLAVSQHLGFVPNEDKTFWRSEFFRESCGGDFYHGRDVRPFYLGALPEGKSRVAMEAYLYSTINGVIRKYISYFGTLTYLYDKQLLRYLLQLLKSVTDKVKFVPENFPEDSGICFISDLYRFRVSYPESLSSKTLSAVWLNEHGMLSFSFLRFVYEDPSSWNARLRYALALKQLWLTRDVEVHPLSYLGPPPKKVRQEAKLRKRGKYVQSRSKWQVSRLDPSALGKAFGSSNANGLLFEATSKR